MIHVFIQTFCQIIIAIASVKYMMPDIRKICRKIADGGESKKKVEKIPEKGIKTSSVSTKQAITQQNIKKEEQKTTSDIPVEPAQPIKNSNLEKDTQKTNNSKQDYDFPDWPGTI